MIGAPSGSDYPDGPERMVEDRTKGTKLVRGSR